jgi:hypothetical protein
MRRRQAAAALVNGLIVWLLPAGLSALSAIGSSLGIGANENAVTVHPPGWTPLVPIMATALRFGFVMLPFAAVAAWRTWVHARRRLELGTSGWQGVGEAAACGLATLLVVAAPGILSHPTQAPLSIVAYGWLAALCGLLVGLLLRISAVIVLTVTEPTTG